jgi:hypothetical protein
VTFDGLTLREAWVVLSPPTGGELSGYPLDVEFEGQPVRVALDGEGHRHLLVPAGAEVISGDQKPSVITLTQRDLSFGGVTGSFVDVRCVKGELAAEFDDFIVDVLNSINGSENPAQQTVQVIGRWRQLFKSALARGLSEQERIGLFAELTVLSAIHSLDDAIASEHWTGPDRDKHDFELPARCLEVKAVGISGANVTIHGLDQLDAHDGRDLHLVLVTVEQDPDGHTLAELVDRVRAQLGGDPEFPRKLAKARWNREDHLSQVQSYSVISACALPVDGATPRLVPSSLLGGMPPEGVSAIQYRIALEALLPLCTSPDLHSVAREATA